MIRQRKTQPVMCGSVICQTHDQIFWWKSSNLIRNDKCQCRPVLILHSDNCTNCIMTGRQANSQNFLANPAFARHETNWMSDEQENPVSMQRAERRDPLNNPRTLLIRVWMTLENNEMHNKNPTPALFPCILSREDWSNGRVGFSYTSFDIFTTFISSNCSQFSFHELLENVMISWPAH